MISVALLKNRLADWERLYEVRLAESDMRLWLDTLRNVNAADDVLLEAFKIVQSKAVRFPKPGHLVAAIEAAVEIVGRRRPPVAESVPHISELPPEQRQEMHRLMDETKKKLGITEMYPELKRRTPEQVEEDGRIERNRQKAAFAAVFPNATAGKPVDHRPAPSSVAPSTPAPAPRPVESTKSSEPPDITDEDIPF